VHRAALPAQGSPGAAELPCAHPLTASVTAVDQAVTVLSFQILDVSSTQWPSSPWPSSPRIECMHALSDPGFFSRWRELADQQLAEKYAHAPGDPPVPEMTTAAYVLRWYLAIPSYLGGLLFYSARRVPSLAPRQLSFRLNLAALQEVALRPGRFWCLPGDPDAGHPDARPVPDEAALGAVLRRQVIAHATRFLTAYGPQVRFGRRTQWAAVSDALDSALLLAGRSFGSPQTGASDARLVLADGGKPLIAASKICQITDEHGRTHWIRRRSSCCFLYALPGIGHPCASCPRVNEAERIRILGTLNPPAQTPSP
jgi:hypothetical protein